MSGAAWRHALDLFTAVESVRCRADASTYTAAMTARGRVGQWGTIHLHLLILGGRTVRTNENRHSNGKHGRVTTQKWYDYRMIDDNYKRGYLSFTT